MNSQFLTQEIIELPDAPALPGLSFRLFRGEEDFPAMAAVLEARRLADQIEYVETAEDLAREYRHLVNSDPYRDVLLALVDGQVVGYSRVSWATEDSGEHVYHLFGFLTPEWRRRGIGRAMLHHNESHLRRLAAGHKHQGEHLFGSFAADTEPATVALLESEGYGPVRHFFTMVRSSLENVPDLPLPGGLEVRPVLPEHYQAVYEANIESFRDHWGFSSQAIEPLALWLENPNFDPSLWRVAWDGDQVAGMVLSYIDRAENEAYGRRRGWTEEICVRRPWRKQGLARALIARSLVALKERGMTEAALGVDTENLTGALRLYEGMGYRPVRRSSSYRKPFQPQS
jgi:mycothiol synthase